MIKCVGIIIFKCILKFTSEISVEKQVICHVYIFQMFCLFFLLFSGISKFLYVKIGDSSSIYVPCLFVCYSFFVYLLRKTVSTQTLNLTMLSRLSQGLVIKVLEFMLQNLQTFLQVLLPLLEKRQLNWKISRLLQSFQTMLKKRCDL